MKNNFKIDLSKYLKYSFPISIVIITTILVLFACFLYRNVYQTIAEAQELTSLRQNIVSERLEKTKFAEILSYMEKKIMQEIQTSTIPIITTSTLSTTTISTSTINSKINTSTSSTTKTTTSTKSTSTIIKK